MSHKYRKYRQSLDIPTKNLKYPESARTETPYNFYLLDITTGQFIHGAYTKKFLDYFIKINFSNDLYKYEIIERPKNG